MQQARVLLGLGGQLVQQGQGLVTSTTHSQGVGFKEAGTDTGVQTGLGGLVRSGQGRVIQGQLAGTVGQGHECAGIVVAADGLGEEGGGLIAAAVHQLEPGQADPPLHLPGLLLKQGGVSGLGAVTAAGAQGGGDQLTLKIGGGHDRLLLSSMSRSVQQGEGILRTAQFTKYGHQGGQPIGGEALVGEPLISQLGEFSGGAGGSDQTFQGVALVASQGGFDVGLAEFGGGLLRAVDAQQEQAAEEVVVED